MLEHSSEGLAKALRELMNAGAIDELLTAISNDEFSLTTGAVTISRLASGQRAVHDAMRIIQSNWQVNYLGLDKVGFTHLIDSVRSAIAFTAAEATKTEVVWTGPKVEGSHLRATRQVIQDIIVGAKFELLVVGYWLAGKDDGEGIINDVIEMLAGAVDRGVKVTMVLDEGEKLYGKDNRNTLIALWPGKTPLPELLTWEIPAGERHLKLHAKVLVADRVDGLVTSANLTMYALDRNMEMGVRMEGRPSDRIALHFDLLRSNDILVLFED